MSEVPVSQGFLFGAATAAHQIEGNNVSSDWWAFENSGRGLITERSGDACDSYHRWREDMQLLRDAGLNAYRFSIEWARIEPVESHFSAAEIQHYVRMVEHAHAIGLEPVVTLHHFTNPLWFTKRGGWTAEDATETFLRYVRMVKPILDAGVRTVITINEPNMAAIMQTVISGEATLQTGLGGGLPLPHEATSHALVAAHHAARELLREQHPGIQVGWAVANQVVQSIPGGEQQADEYREPREDFFLRAAIGDDIIGVQSYTRSVFGPDGLITPDDDVERTLTGWEFYPEALGHAVRHTREIVGDVPILVTENGIATDDDSRRIVYTRGALAALAEQIADGADVRGYLHWSALDNYEWGRYAPTFGLIAVDRTTFERTPKPSLAWLGGLAKRRVLPA